MKELNWALIQSRRFETFTLELWNSHRTWDYYMEEPERDDRIKAKEFEEYMGPKEGLEKGPKFSFIYHPLECSVNL